jgi:antitoxin (DNA-binding transcriptional repressor) of toxin-antitoxin stability system
MRKINWVCTIRFRKLRRISIGCWRRPLAGNRVVITRNGEAVAELVSLRKADATRGQRRHPGTLKGRIAYTDDAFAPLNKKELKDMGFE